MAWATFLGHAHDLARAGTCGIIAFGPKLGARERFIDEIDGVLLKRTCGSGQTSKLAVSMALLSLQARVWYEHVPSMGNPSDWLSRDGFLDPRVARRPASGEWTRLNAVAPPRLFHMASSEISERVAALGGSYMRES